MSVIRRRFTLKHEGYLHQPQKKKYYNEQLFTEVAPKYDLITRILSLGRDAAWKRRLVDALPAGDAPLCVDLACGTGDLSFLLAGKYPRGRVIGLDLTESMLQIAVRRGPPSNLSFSRQDMCVTDLPSRCVDIVTGGYALRNAPDLGQVLGEIQRILKPGSVAAFLDFSKPPARAAQFWQYWLLKSWGSLWGLLLHGNPEVYAYIAESLKLFPNRIQLRERIAECGFRVVQHQRFYFGMLELLVLESRVSRSDSAGRCGKARLLAKLSPPVGDDRHCWKKCRG